MATFFVFSLLFFLSALIVGLINPYLFSWLFKSKTSRKNIALVFGLFSVVFFVAIIFVPSDEKTNGINTMVKTPATDDEWVQGIIYQGALTEVSLRYIEATIYSDTLFRDAQKISDKERIALLDQTIEKWAEAKMASEQFSAVAELLPDYDASVSYKNNDSRFFLIEKVLAATVEEDIDKAWQKKKELGEEKLLQLIDKAPMGQRVQEAAKIFGTSIEVAEVVLQDLRAEETKKALKEVEKYDKYSKAAETIAAGAKVAVFIGGVVAGGGMVTLAGKAAHIVISSVAGAGLVMDVSKTAVNVGIADENGKIAAIAKAKDAQFFKEMSYVVGITDIVKALGQFEKVVSAAGGLKKLLTADGLKKIAENKQLMTDMKSDVSGNLQTIVDSGPAAWDFYTKNLEAKTIVLDTDTPGKVVFKSVSEALAVKELPTTIAISDYIKKIFSGAQKISTEIFEEISKSVSEEEISPVFTKIPEEIRIDADSSWKGIFAPASTLSLRARCAYKTAAGGNYPLEVYVNDQIVTGSLLNKKMSFTYKDGRTYSYRGGTGGKSWMLFYIPQMGLSNSSAAGGYQVVTDPGQANNYKWSISSYLNDASYMKVRFRNNGACIGHQIVIRGLSMR